MTLRKVFASDAVPLSLLFPDDPESYPDHKKILAHFNNNSWIFFDSLTVKIKQN